jgi:hypothetical protein
LSSAELGTPLTIRATALTRLPGWLWLGLGLYALLLINGNPLLNDPDTFWHIAVGQSILDRGTFPQADTYSFTKAGAPWISTSWLAQIVLAKAYDLGGWGGPVVLTAFVAAASFALLAFILSRHIRATYAVAVSFAAFALTAQHLLARPHVLTLPVMLLWVHGLLQASDRREPPSFWLLPCITLWANLHGGFVFGLAMVGAVACDALWNAEATQRRPLAIRWIVFGGAALVASCITPYGWDSILASRKILGLGELLRLIDEWKPADFSSVTPFEIILLAAIGGTLYSGARLSAPRIVLVLGLLHMALTHVRNLEIFALLAPLAVVSSVAVQLKLHPRESARPSLPPLATAALIAAVGLSGWGFATYGTFSPPRMRSQAAAADALEAHHARRVLNELSFAGYLISRGIPVFIDGRAELYGEQFALAYDRALRLADVDGLFDLLKTYDIDAVLLTPEAPAASLLNRVPGWQRVYSDNNAILYVAAAN